MQSDTIEAQCGDYGAVVTVKRDRYRADLVVDSDGRDAFEQVHVISGPDTGRLLHSARFAASNLGRVHVPETLTAYTQAMLGTIIRQQR